LHCGKAGLNRRLFYNADKESIDIVGHILLMHGQIEVTLSLLLSFVNLMFLTDKVLLSVENELVALSVCRCCSNSNYWCFEDKCMYVHTYTVQYMHSTHINLSMKDTRIKKLCNNGILGYTLPELLVAVFCFFRVVCCLFLLSIADFIVSVVGFRLSIVGNYSRSFST
jgi:hypothetical protein